MLTQKELGEIRSLLESSQNPLFFFDNDADGLCSFLLLQRGLGRGKGVSIKSFPNLNETYLRKVNELNPDYVFILDKPRVDKEFIEGVLEKNIPIVWIDHHDVQVEPGLLDRIHYFNSFPSSEPVTYLAQNIFKRKKDLWLAMIGCIGDVYMPDFAKDFSKEHPELFDSKLDAFDSMYCTEIGRAIKILNFALKDTTTNVLKSIRLLLKADSIYDLFEENSNTRHIYQRYNQISKIYNGVLKKAEKEVGDSKILVFTYGGNMSISSEISNELFFKYPDKFIFVGKEKESKISFSVRGLGVKKIVSKMLEKIPNSIGGGHENACGLQIRAENLSLLKEKLNLTV